MKRKDALRLRLGLEQLEGRRLLTSLFVATNGNDSNPGTQSQPFRTIAHGIRELAPGDTLLVRGGTYAESLTSWKGGTSWSSPVTVAAYPGEAVTIRPGQGASMALDFRGASAAYIIVRGFTIDANNVTNDAIKITSSGSGGAANHIRIADCEVENAPEEGILTTAGAGYNEFINLNVHNNGTASGWHGHGLYIGTSNNIVTNSNVHDNAGFGIHVYGSPSTACNNNLVSDNKIYNNARAGDWGYGIALCTGSGNRAFNNVVWGNNGGIQVDYAASNSEVYNNTIYDNGSYGIYVGAGSQSALVRNNIVYHTLASSHSLGKDYMNQGSGTIQDHNLMGVDPLFVNAAAADFHLRSGSPAIDSGVTLAETTSDLEGNPRPLGNGYDIGALESH